VAGGRIGVGAPGIMLETRRRKKSIGGPGAVSV
jgi:hypothetical protein